MSLYLGNKKVTPVVYIKGTGASVTAINKTGSIITAGSKVWLNENQQTAGDKLSFDTQYALTTITRDGQAILTNQTTTYTPMTLYSVGSNWSLTEITSINERATYIQQIKYGDNNSIFAICQNGTWRIDNISPWSTRVGFSGYVGDNVFSVGSSSSFEFYKVNLDTGEILNTYTAGGGTTYSSQSDGWLIDNTVYSGVYRYGYACYTLNDETNTATRASYTITNSNNKSYYCAGKTTDDRYIVSSMGGNGRYFANASSGDTYYLRIISIDDLANKTFRVLNQAEMQEDMQKWYVTNCYIVFNPYTGILTCTAKQGTDYGVYKYENGTWITLPIDLGEIFTSSFTGITSGLMLSDDMSRATIAVNDVISGYRGRVINLTSTSGYAAVPYRFYNVNENTITGYAINDAVANLELKVNIAGL